MFLSVGCSLVVSIFRFSDCFPCSESTVSIESILLLPCASSFILLHVSLDTNSAGFRFVRVSFV